MSTLLEVEQLVRQGFGRQSLDVLTNEVGRLMSILARSWSANCSWPIEIQMSHLVCDFLNFIRLELVVVVQYYVMSRGDCALINELRHKEEIDVTTSCYGVIQN